MRFTHSADSTRLAEIIDTSTTEAPCLVVQHTDANGKARKKSFKKKSKVPMFVMPNLWNNASKFLIQQGFVAPAPQDGLLTWLTATHEPYPHGHHFTLDRARDQVWVPDTGALRRIQRGSLERVDVDIGAEVMPRELRCSEAGTVLALITIEPGTPKGSSPWRAPAAGPVSYGVLSVDDDDQVHLVVQVPFEAGGTEIDSLGLCDDGRFLAPHADGAGLYAPDGSVVVTWSAVRTTHYPPRGAVSADGRWVALTHDKGSIRIIDRQGGREHVVSGPFEQVLSLDIDDTGTAAVRGLGPDHWGLYRTGPSGSSVHQSPDIEAALSPSGTKVVSVEYNRVQVCRPGPDEPGALLAEQALPQLPMGRRARCQFWDDETVIARTDLHVLAELDLRRL